MKSIKYIKSTLYPFLILLIVSNTFFVSPYKAQLLNVELLTSLSYQCFSKKNLNICRDALKRVEELQLFAGYKENYACQTRLLGLESKLIMSMFNIRRNRFFTNNLDEVKTFCKLFLEM